MQEALDLSFDRLLMVMMINVTVVHTRDMIILIHYVSVLQILFGDVYSANFVVKKWYFYSVYSVCPN